MTKSVAKDNRLMFQFSPTTTGVYQLQVLSMGRHIGKSPFEVNAFAIVLLKSVYCRNKLFQPVLCDSVDSIAEFI